MKNIYMIGNTHFDPVWLWTWDDAMASIHSTFRSALDRMKEDEDFIYSFATPPVFEWIKKTDPEMFDEIKARVKEGRWDICEGWWLQPDCFSATGESYARHSLYGQRYMKKNFDKFSSCVFNIDSFGHNSQTPQILRKSHMNYYCMVRPEVYHFPITEPYFKWTGKDGSELMAFRAGQFHEICNKNMIEAVNITEQKMADISCDEMMIYGVTNHGGAPTKKAIADIHYLNETKPYELNFSTVEGYFKAQGRPACEVNGEMLTKDFGPYDRLYSKIYETAVQDNNIFVKGALATVSKPPFLDYSCIYSFYEDGSVLVDFRAKFDQKRTFLPRLGFEFKTKSSEFEYFGYGPNESYVDMHHGSKMGMYKSNAKMEYVDYIKPQEHGNHYNTKYLKLGDYEIISQEGFEFNVSEYSTAELSSKAHNFELKKDEYVNVRIDCAVSGIGSGSCGAQLVDCYRCNNEEFAMKFLIKKASTYGAYS